MKSFFILFFVLFFLLGSPLLSAEKDLIVKDFVFQTNKLEFGQSYHYILEVENIGDEKIITCLPAIFSFNEVPPVPKYPHCLLDTLAHPRGEATKDIKEVLIYSPSKNISKKIKPARREVTYQGGLNRLGEPMVLTREVYTVPLQPGEILRYDSQDSFLGLEKLGGFSFGNQKPSLEKTPFTLYVLLDRLGTMDENKDNNLFTKEFFLEPTIKQGPLPETPQNKELLSEKEYFVFRYFVSTHPSCFTLQEKEICFQSKDTDKDGKDDLFLVTVNGVQKVYHVYNLLMNWLMKIFSDGKLAPPAVIEGVEITFYEKGAKLKLLS